ncbi:HlyD family efflux transporter periplasmic adaptor subunit [Bacillus sp. ES1-5]|uniref:HlyD family efflux transporter periplasmic adaptor subunit n=1 Tax=Bacillus sp. ES1-5 TaxID=1502999 RepID=UPI001F0C5EFE|nr:HlyD family secretion protein [Bacillus sp. ES1-5]
MNKIYSFDQLSDSVELLEKKPPRVISWLLGFLSLIFIVFFIWAYFSKIDIVSKGTAIVQGKFEVSVMRNQSAGIVETVLVRSGDEVKKGDTLVQLKNRELENKQNQFDQVVKNLEQQKKMLEELKRSIQLKKPIFSNEVDEKVKTEYKAYEEGYQSLQNEKENEIKTLDHSKISNEQDDVLQGLIFEKENNQREIESLIRQKGKENILNEKKELLNDEIVLLQSQKDNLVKRIEQRSSFLESERKKVEEIKKGKQDQKKYGLSQYKENTIVSVNQRIQALEQSIFEKKQEVDSANIQGETMSIKALKDGIVQLPVVLQSGDLVDSGQEIISIVPKENEKKIKMLLSAQEIKGVKKGDTVQYSFQLKKTDKQVGKVTYVSVNPIFDKTSKSYMYEIEATIEIDDLDELHTGMIGRGSVIVGEERAWKFILKKFDFISN